ncbi:Bug family tripartite tricarboxylate transporter substrate binding protein [Orrella marina]|uniref:Tripartite tricarboxylate transporter substrate binding protein n=1 Tax=Orrella marina TaxID=2163011 RepID=A0A2R4XMG7_9BURK|nr:tripartite tricarboxylate transporter substrate binding protein [Orrella marina]AWB34961.1 hypothetical protein DBV39_15890 [Orrella marina]
MLRFTGKIVMAFALSTGIAWAQDYPNKPIRIIVPYSPGGGTDAVARLVGEKVSNSLKQPVIVENRAGASANIGTQAVARSPADGYTILITAPNFTTSEAMFDNLGWKFEDFIPVIQLARYSNILVAGPNSPFKSMQEVLDAAKADPGGVNYGSAGAGSNAHLSMELLSVKSGVSMQHIPYKGGGPLKTDLLGGHIALGVDGLAGLSDLINTDKVKPLAVMAPGRTKLAPEIPSLGDVGIVDVDASGWSGALVPAGTPKDAVDKLQAAFAEALSDPAIVERMNFLGLEPVGGSSEQFKSYLMDERTKWADLINERNLKP